MGNRIEEGGEDNPGHHTARRYDRAASLAFLVVFAPMIDSVATGNCQLITVVSKRGNKYAQAYCSPDGWTRAFPMKRRWEARETLSLLFARDGVPNVMVMDGAREQVMGEFRHKCRQAGVHVK